MRIYGRLGCHLGGHGGFGGRGNVGGRGHGHPRKSRTIGEGDLPASHFLRG